MFSLLLSRNVLFLSIPTARYSIACISGNSGLAYYKTNAMKIPKQDLQLQNYENEHEMNKDVVVANEEPNQEFSISEHEMNKDGVVDNEGPYYQESRNKIFEEDEHTNNFKLPENSDINQKLQFIKDRTIQPTIHTFSNLNLDIQKLYKRIMPNGSEVSRNWLSLHVQNEKILAIYCPICIVFSVSQSPFTSGYTKFTHIHIAIKKHECSVAHNNAVQNYIRASTEISIEFSINRDLMQLKKTQTEENIHVIKQIFEIIKFLGKQGLPFRGSGNSESLYHLGRTSDINTNRGNFLELVQFTAKRDPILQKHLSSSIKNSERRKYKQENNSKSSRGRGSLVTFLSKTTINKIIDSILNSIRDKIKQELSGQKFSVQVDSTQDVGVFDQAAICIRYIFNGNVTERLFALLKVEDSSGEGYYNMLKSLFQKHNMNFTNVIGEAFDGASNMRGQFSGLQSRIKEQNPKSIYIWCYSHVLNLCICDTCQNINAKNLFGFLNRLSTFFRESFKRMNVWIEQNNTSTGTNKMKRLQKIGDNNTRWWSREKALFWVFDGDEPLFSTVICALHFVSNSPKFEAKICSEASSLLEKLCCFKIILTSHIFIRIFKIVGPTSRYLQTKGLDLLTAWNMIESVKSEISKIDFESVYNEAYIFSKKINKHFSDLHLPEDIIVEDQLPTSRVYRKKRLCDELCEDQVLTNPKEKFRVETYRVIIDQILSSLNQRFSNNSNLIADIQYLIPKSFNLVENMPDDALTHIADLINIKKEHLKMELQNFSIIYPNLITSVVEKTKYMYKHSTKNITNSGKSSDESSAENIISDDFCKSNLNEFSFFSLKIKLIYISFVH
ncbi:hypothetical protein QTP88_029365 [Uroleucon formosanum]